MKIAIAILNWNGIKLLKQFLPSVVEHSTNADIYVIDNASSDDSVIYVISNFPSVQIIKLEDNYGYAGGYNHGLKQIKADIFCLLNNDVEVTPNWIQPILNQFKKDNTIAVIQPKILDYTHKTQFEYAGAAGGFIDKFGYPYCRGRIFTAIENNHGQFNDTSEIFWASGACFFIRSEVFKSHHGFDESFFAHMEEIDLCWRLFNNNQKVYYVGESSVYHLGGGTLQNINPKKTYLNFRNSLYTLVKNADRNIFFLILSRLILDGLAAMRFLVKLQFAHINAILRAHLSFYVKLPQLFRWRKKNIQKSNYFKIKSIVWKYFVLNQKTYHRL
ncbi:glycosyltransferase family 2 protein [Paucihalobacter ruber]|uniref:Glycosyltransferase family 2 protein n=1 Tax=Paucihalobacter ruber TaxID=2567861 RepID=A0A506PI61_9FLAO|nr:glycosyltransferase family 2 protein [Paucihalobacter ruber]TPV33254.1 glycosyltransferase family 2 protein [Paucihalobacter ruber]